MTFPAKTLLLASASSMYTTFADSATMSPTGAFSFECWIKWNTIPATDGSNNITVLTKDDGQPNRSFECYFIGTAGSVQMRIQISTDGTNGNTNSAGLNITTPVTGQWYHYAWVYTTPSTGTFEAFVNGVSQSTVTGMGGSVFDSNAVGKLGARKNGASAAIQFVDGELSLARFWTKALIASDITTNYLKVLGATASLSAEWTLDNVYTDNSGNSNTLTAVASPTFATDPVMGLVNTLVLAGGASGGKSDAGDSAGAGGGGAGGLVLNTSLAIISQAYTITVGAGGATVSSAGRGNNGSDSVFATITATGGGGGGQYVANGGVGGKNGGSGGGGSVNNTTGAGGTGVSGQGTAGGSGAVSTSSNAGGGGGGATSAGTSAANGSNNGGNGGTGTASSISGSSVTYAGGGGGGAYTSGTVGNGGTGGGGAGANQANNATAGTANTGGGGGGAGTNATSSGNSGAGGSGMVIVAFPNDLSKGIGTNSTGGTITTSGGNQIHTFTSNGTFTPSATNASASTPRFRALLGVGL